MKSAVFTGPGTLSVGDVPKRARVPGQVHAFRIHTYTERQRKSKPHAESPSLSLIYLTIYLSIYLYLSFSLPPSLTHSLAHSLTPSLARTRTHTYTQYLVRVRFVGVNPSDVKHLASGMRYYSASAATAQNPVPFGFEGSGDIVEAPGDGENDGPSFAVGDQVFFILDKMNADKTQVPAPSF